MTVLAALLLAVSMATAQVPYLPPATPPKPTISAPPVFDARAMVDATKRKVDNPAYGQMPKGTPEARAAAEAARAGMRRKRRRNKILGWVMAFVFFAVLGGVGYALYRTYQEDQQDQDAETEATETGDGDAEPGALSPLGEQVEVIITKARIRNAYFIIRVIGIRDRL